MSLKFIPIFWPINQVEFCNKMMREACWRRNPTLDSGPAFCALGPTGPLMIYALTAMITQQTWPCTGRPKNVEN